MPAEVAVNGTLVVSADLEALADESNGVAEIVAGYTLQERIGAGGYGEVWRAIGPGGLPKAVKILHGNYDGVVAETELQSLELMRELRHPFLLNVERIEVIGNRLIIVTELADQTLEERFDELVADGSLGIPRDELLNYLKEAADALDFMSGQHGLQHLDIKPSNLLLQGGHLKVADFGLIKNVDKTNVSMVAGFTPLYAPPELFDGRPTSSSDQYSLAIVYQVMLTGVPPFAGRTAAQLTAQHLSSKPDLSALPSSDHAAVSRTLSKNPSARFPNCREFVERLSQRRQSSSRARTSRPAESSTPKSTGAPAPLPSQRTDPVVPRSTPVALPPIELDGTETTYRPTLVLGLGGLAGEILCRLRHRQCGRFGTDTSLAAFPCLYIDTNSRATAAARNYRPGPGLTDRETLDAPLRDREHYRKGSGELLEWLSRRWLYNIPRSGQVEGLRPLGRLAFVDHNEAIRERLQHALAAATTAESLEQASRCLGQTICGQTIDVVVVASLCGGTGSGMVLDAGYLVRDVCASLGIELGGVTGVMLQATCRRGQSEELASANAIACLKELAVYGGHGSGYPGDPACRLLRFDGPPFDHPYLVRLGEGLNAPELEEQLDRVADYLYHDTLTPVRTFLTKCRNNADSTTPVSLRTFGVASLEDFTDEDDHRQAVGLCLALLRQCSARLDTSAPPAVGADAREYAAKLLNDLQLDTDTLVEIAGSIFRSELGGNVGRYFRGRLEGLLHIGADHNQWSQSCHQLIEEVLCATPTDETPDDHPARILTIFRQQLAASADKTVGRLQKRILGLCSDSRWRWTAACETVAEIVRQLRETHEALINLSTEFEDDPTGNRADAAHDGAQLLAGFGDQPAPDGGDPLAMPVQTAMRRFCGCITRSLVQHVLQVSSTLRETTETFRTELLELEADFRQAQIVTAAAATRDPQPTGTDFDALATETFERLLCCAGALRLADVVTGNVPRAEAVTSLSAAALAGVLERTLINDTSRSDRVCDSIEPRLNGVGGGRRVLTLLPESVDRSAWVPALQSRFGDCVSVVDGDQAGQLLCCEVQGIDLVRAVGALTGQNDRLAEVASRIHTRIDVDWN